jgi:multidrug efflux pump subunit AcrA (membrane-fusion protein)
VSTPTLQFANNGGHARIGPLRLKAVSPGCRFRYIVERFVFRRFGPEWQFYLETDNWQRLPMKPVEEVFMAVKTVFSSLPIAAAALALLFAALPAPADEMVYPGFTKPSESRDVAFNTTNGSGVVVSEQPVKEGDTVTAGQLLAAQNSVAEEAAVKVAQIEADSDVQIQAAKADHDAKVVELKRKQEMRKDNVVGASELEAAQVEEVIAALKIKLAEEEKQKAVATVAEKQTVIALKRLTSPIAGIVAKINTHVGEAPSNDVSKPVMTIIQNNPLYVEVDLPTSVVKSIRVKQNMDIRYVGEDKWLSSEVVFVAPQADARSDSQKVRLQLSNAEGRNSGMQVQVKAPEAVAAAPEH